MSDRQSVGMVGLGVLLTLFGPFLAVAITRAEPPSRRYDRRGEDAERRAAYDHPPRRGLAILLIGGTLSAGGVVLIVLGLR